MLSGRTFLVFTEDEELEPGTSLALIGATVVARGGNCTLWSLPALAR
jgi:hypothetical protein